MLWMSLLVVIFLAWHFAQIQKKESSKKFTEFMAMVDAGEVSDVSITGNEIKGHTVCHEECRWFAHPVGSDRRVDCLLARKVMITYHLYTALVWTSFLLLSTLYTLILDLWHPT